MRLSLLPVFLLSQVLASAWAEDQKILGNDPPDDSPRLATTDVSADQPRPIIPGAELVDAAYAELRKLPQPSHVRRRHRTSGLLSTVLRHALKALPALQLGAPAQEPSSESDASLSVGPLADAVRLLGQAAHQNNSDALYLLAEMNFHGNYSHPRDLPASFAYYRRLAATTGNSSAQYMLGVFHGTGLGDVVPRDQAKALLYHTFAAEQGDTRAQMAAAFRHLGGIGTPHDCEKAAVYYKLVADKAVAWYLSGPPLGMVWVSEAWSIAEEDGGLYGTGASVSSSGINSDKAGGHSEVHAAIDDVIEYLDLLSHKGDFKASYNLGRIYYDGRRGLERDPDMARKYFFAVAKRYWKKDGRVLDNAKQGIETTAGRAAGYIGRMYLRAEAAEQSFERARVWFERGISLGDAQSQHALAGMLLKGQGGPRNDDRAVKLLRASADQGYAPAQVDLGVLYLDHGEPEDIRGANNYFELAARWGSIEAHYYLAEMIHKGVGRDRDCQMAVGYYKTVAEKAEPLLSGWGEANRAYEEGDHDAALLGYVLAAEQGFEMAQNNVAFMLDPARSRVPLSGWLDLVLGSAPGGGRRRSRLLTNPSLALVYWTRSSRQHNVDSTVRMGDYYYHGIGADADVAKAVQCYVGASDYSQSAQALFNLGWMHENGIGLKQDFHLAKRYYDQALEVNEEAYLPVTLGLVKLRVRSAWNTLTHGPVHSIQDEPVIKKDWSISEWISNFLDDGETYEETLYDDIYDDTRSVDGDGNGNGDADADAPNDAGSASGETLLIIGIAFVLSGLLYYRQRRQHAHRRRQRRQDPRPRGNRHGGLAAALDGRGAEAAETGAPPAPAPAAAAAAPPEQVPGQAPAQAPTQAQGQLQELEPAPPDQHADGGGSDDEGLFPQPGDPEAANWMAGGVGH